MNTGFFSPSQSCSSQIAAITATQLLPPSLATHLLADKDTGIFAFPLSTPLVGIAAELLMAYGLLSSSIRLRRLTIVSVQIFHVMLAIPLPPSSFYPYSAICILACIPIHPEAFTAALRVHGRNVAIFGLLVLWPLLHWRGLEQTHKEYPPYSQYPLGVSWVVCIGVLNSLAAIKYPSKADVLSSSSSSSSSSLTSNLMFLLILLIGALPYLGVRTYPAFAMFSNLRVEERSNHWFLPSWENNTFLHSLSHTQPVRILDTNLNSLRAFQIDLAPYYPQSTLDALKDLKLESALWICPPAWKHLLPEFRAFSIPLFELHRAVVDAVTRNETFYVDYRRGGVQQRFERSEKAVEGDLGLLESIPWWKRAVFRFRAFDVNDDTCRH
eukprot:CAMPEP_0197520320 /NCGR_PEP_ID=MMETSP1318-20131121/5644_1 /TAXON_ID=552666 /ORGANISM="Partenskyella glossopodia, Strain RCC365" /LENGTH=382 /DNA_ID=CAMNT_0043071813 /DNA_START=469 /DNA_END=1620 /DNA_ORIENTATION=-